MYVFIDIQHVYIYIYTHRHYRNIHMNVYMPVVPHKVSTEVSKIGHL